MVEKKISMYESSTGSAGVHVELSRGCENLKTVGNSEIAPFNNAPTRNVLAKMGDCNELVYALHCEEESLKNPYMASICST